MPSKDMFPFRANRARMRREFNAQAKIGKYGKTGLDRVAFTPVYGEVRDLAEGWMKAAGLNTRVDAVGNLYGRKEGRVRGLPAVMAGSHLDSQSPGGRFDGPAGVLTALEAFRRIEETGIAHDHPIEIVAFVGEESACGMTVFGSSVATGVVGVKDLKNTVHPPSGKSLYEAIEAVGGNPARVRSCRIKEGALKAFLELHIEQGPVLESAEVPHRHRRQGGGIHERRGSFYRRHGALGRTAHALPKRRGHRGGGLHGAHGELGEPRARVPAPDDHFRRDGSDTGMGVHRARRREAFL